MFNRKKTIKRFEDGTVQGMCDKEIIDNRLDGALDKEYSRFNKYCESDIHIQQLRKYIDISYKAKTTDFSFENYLFDCYKLYKYLLKYYDSIDETDFLYKFVVDKNINEFYDIIKMSVCLYDSCEEKVLHDLNNDERFEELYDLSFDSHEYFIEDVESILNFVVYVYQYCDSIDDDKKLYKSIAFKKAHEFALGYLRVRNSLYEIERGDLKFESLISNVNDVNVLKRIDRYKVKHPGNLVIDEILSDIRK